MHGGSPKDHMLHRFGHRVVRGTLLFLGVPDGRRGSAQKMAESATYMTGKQAMGVANYRHSAEVYALGHNPSLRTSPFEKSIVLSSPSLDEAPLGSSLYEDLNESMFLSFERLLGAYVFFWAMASQVSSLPFLKYEHSKTQSRTRVATTASPSASPLGARLTVNASLKKNPALKTMALTSILMMAVFPAQAFAAVVQKIEGGLLYLKAERGDTLWSIAKTLLGVEGNESPGVPAIWERIRLIAKSAGIADPEKIYAGKTYVISSTHAEGAVNAFGNAPVAVPAHSHVAGVASDAPAIPAAAANPGSIADSSAVIADSSLTDITSWWDLSAYADFLVDFANHLLSFQPRKFIGRVTELIVFVAAKKPIGAN